jgi:hypothetical protein
MIPSWKKAAAAEAHFKRARRPPQLAVFTGIKREKFHAAAMSRRVRCVSGCGVKSA